MRFQKEKKHMIDIIFPIALFFVFAVSALIAILFAANLYQSAAGRAREHYTTNVSLSYIREKIRQNDAEGAVSIGTLEGTDSLILRQNLEGNLYTTYIYEYEGVLRELFIKDGAVPSLESGKDIIDVSGFSMKKLSDTLFEFTASDESGYSDSITIGIRSRSEEAMP